MRAAVVALLVATSLAAWALAQSTSSGSSGSGAGQFKDFLMLNRLPSGMPRSYALWPTNYFPKVPKAERPNHYTKAMRVPECNNWTVPAENMNNYMFQTEELLTALGLNIYDGAMWCVALSLLGESKLCENYITNTLVLHKTVQFPDIRGDKACAGIMEYGQCTDPNQEGVCGFCYGDAAGNAAKSLTVNNAYFFRMISDYWAIEKTVDARCPQLNHLWTWNDYKPILGENAWALLTGPINNAMIRYGNDPTKIPDSDNCFMLGIPFLSALEVMKVGDTGAFYFTPRNTWFGFSKTAQNIGSTFSTENQASLLAGLKALHFIIDQATSTTYKSYLPQIARYIADLKKILLRAYSKELGFFRQGGTYDDTTGSLTWGQNGEPLFAVDCQTWVSAVLGTTLIDGTFGAGTAYNLWQTTKLIANYSCPNGDLCGVGYTSNNYSGQVLSGEWTYGAVNWLRVMKADSNYSSDKLQSLENDIGNMLFGLETYVWDSTPIDNSTHSYNSVKYSNERYWIPFGWYANPLPATSSTAWAVLILDHYNPFNVDGGKYSASY